MATVTSARDRSGPTVGEDLATIAMQEASIAGDFEHQPAEAIEGTDEFVPVSNLAALLDQFTANITNPQAHTVGSFAHTIQALHSELSMLARTFGAEAQTVDGQGLEFVDFDDTPEDGGAPSEPVEPGIAAAEELEHLCRELSR